MNDSTRSWFRKVALPILQLSLIVSVGWMVAFPGRPPWFGSWVFTPLVLVTLTPGFMQHVRKTPGQLYQGFRDGSIPRSSTIEKCATFASLFGMVWLAFH